MPDAPVLGRRCVQLDYPKSSVVFYALRFVFERSMPQLQLLLVSLMDRYLNLRGGVGGERRSEDYFSVGVQDISLRDLPRRKVISRQSPESRVAQW